MHAHQSVYITKDQCSCRFAAGLLTNNRISEFKELFCNFISKAYNCVQKYMWIQNADNFGQKITKHPLRTNCLFTSSPTIRYQNKALKDQAITTTRCHIPHDC